MATVSQHCQVCRQTTTWNITKITPRRTNKKEAIVALRCTKCERVCLRKVDQDVRDISKEENDMWIRISDQQRYTSDFTPPKELKDE